MKVKMSKEEYARFVDSEAAYARKEAARRQRLEEAERLERMLVVDFSDVWPGVAHNDVLRWPLINHGLMTPKQAATSTVTEWLTGDVRLGQGPHSLTSFGEGGIVKTEYNNQHIFRVPWTEWISNAVLASVRYGSSLTPALGREKLLEMLDQIETAMRHSVRASSGHYRTAGSVESLLGRWPRKDDHVQFSVLRDMQLRRYPDERYQNSDRDARAFAYEFLIETSWITYRKGR